MTDETSKPVVLDPTQVRAFEDILAVFSSPGWKHLEKRLREDQAITQDVRRANDLSFVKGQLSVLDNILAWPDTWAHLYDLVQAGDVEVDEGFGQ